MKKVKLIKLCDWSLLAIIIVMLASSIQLEIIAGGISLWVWAHIVLGIIFFGLIACHLQLHFQWQNWLRLLWKQKSSNTRWLTAIGILTLLTALIATGGWLASPEHSIIGAVHGKLGFVFIALATWHLIRRIHFYKR